MTCRSRTGSSRRCRPLRMAGWSSSRATRMIAAGAAVTCLRDIPGSGRPQLVEHGLGRRQRAPTGERSLVQDTREALELHRDLRAMRSQILARQHGVREALERVATQPPGLRTVLNAQPDLEVVAQATDGEQAVEQALSQDVHLAILDISMPRKTGLQAAREITHRKPEVRVLMLSMHDNEQFLFEAIRAGASGHVLKSSVDRDLIEAC